MACVNACKMLKKQKLRSFTTQKEITSQTDQWIVILSSKTYGFEDKLTKY